MLATTILRIAVLGITVLSVALLVFASIVGPSEASAGVEARVVWKRNDWAVV
jgi:hypothetical protein